MCEQGWKSCKWWLQLQHCDDCLVKPPECFCVEARYFRDFVFRSLLGFALSCECEDAHKDSQPYGWRVDREKNNRSRNSVSQFCIHFWVCWHSQHTACQEWLEQRCLDPLCSEQSHCWQLSEVMQPRPWRETQTRLFIKANGKMKGQGELEWPVWRGRFKVKANSSGLYGDKGKIMSTENSPWEGIWESSIRLPRRCSWLSLTAPCARMIGLGFL